MTTQLLERRATTVEIPTDAPRGQFVARAVAYDTVDSYRTRFRRGVFNRGLEDGRPVAVLIGHDTSRMAGTLLSWEDRSDGLWVRGQLNLDSPSGSEGYALLTGGASGIPTTRSVSVGFVRIDQEPAEDARGVTDIIEGELLELSIVFRDAVPGSIVTDVRNANYAYLAAAEGRIEMDEADRMIAEALSTLGDHDLAPVVNDSGELDYEIEQVLAITRSYA